MAEPSSGNGTPAGTAIEFRRIAIALDCSTINRAALSAAVALAAATRSRLHAVFVEDQCLYQLAELPGARQISGSGRTSVAIDVEGMRRQIARASDAARRAVSDAASKARVEWAFDTVRGLLDDALTTVGADAEIVALGSSRATIGRVHAIASLRKALRHGTGIIVAPARPSVPAGPVVALVGPGADPGRIVHTAESIAERAGGGHRFVVLGASPTQRDRLAADVTALATRAAPIIKCDDDALSAVTWCVRRERAGLAIADIDYACFDEATSAERVAEGFECPLLLVQV